jgi:hypothetical protein
MIEEYMRLPGSSRAILGVLLITAALIGTPLAIFALQQQQHIRQHADTSLSWLTDQSAASSCPSGGSGAIINATFSNTEPNQSSYSMDVTAVDRQTGKSVVIGTIKGGSTKTGVIDTGKANLSSGTVDFNLKWTDGHSGTDSRSASYKAVSGCYPAPTPAPSMPPCVGNTYPASYNYGYPTPTIRLGYPTTTPIPCPPTSVPSKPYTSTTPPYPTPSKPYSTPNPSYGPTPTICPTLGAVKNVRIDCPNCAKY